MIHKTILKEAKEKHTEQMNGKIDVEELQKVTTLLKSADYPFPPFEVEDEPMTMKSEVKHPEKLPTYMMELSDEYSLHLTLKVVFSIVKFLSSYEKHSEYIEGFISLFGLKCNDPDDVSCYEFSESDRDILIGILAPQILNKQTQDNESEVSIGINGNQPSENGVPQKFNDWLTFADIENQTFLELIEKDCFAPLAEKDEEEDKYTNINPDNELSDEQTIEKEHFLPYFKKDYKIAFGSPNYYPFLKCIQIIYERLRLAKKIIEDKVESDFQENRERVVHDYKAYKKSQERIQENKGIEKEPQNLNVEEKEITVNDEIIKEKVSQHKMAILIGIGVTKFKSKLDSGTFEELVRVFLGEKSFFFFTIDKIIALANKSFSCLFNDEYQKSFSFSMFSKYNKIIGNMRSKL